MRRTLQRLWVHFLAVFAITLALSLFIFQVKLDFETLAARYVALNILFAILIASGSAIILILAWLLLWPKMSRFARQALAATALLILRSAITSHQQLVSCIGLAQRDGSVVIGLQTGANDGIYPGMRFSVCNATDGKPWGTIEVIEMDERSCICIVSDRINAEFWDDLEQRMNRDASPPIGVTFSREAPAELLANIAQLLASWGEGIR